MASDANANAKNEQQETKDAGTAEVQQQKTKENEQGFRGREVDPTPNENYSVGGVTKNAPTPETDAKAAQKAREAVAGTR